MVFIRTGCCVYNPVLERHRQLYSWGSPASHHSQSSDPWASEGPCLAQGWTDIRGWLLDVTHMCRSHICTRTHACFIISNMELAVRGWIKSIGPWDPWKWRKSRWFIGQAFHLVYDLTSLQCIFSLLVSVSMSRFMTGCLRCCCAAFPCPGLPLWKVLRPFCEWICGWSSDSSGTPLTDSW